MTEIAVDVGWLPVERDHNSAPFYDAAARRVLLLRRCRSCSQWSAPEAKICSACGGVQLDWAEATGCGTLVSWTVVHRAPIPAFGEIAPYLLGLVELEEGPWVYSRLTNVDSMALKGGSTVRADFVRPHGSESYPVFVVA